MLIEYQKIMDLLENTPNQQSKFRTKSWIWINDCSHQTCNINSQVKLKALMLNSGLGNYGDAYIHVTETISVLNKETAVAPQ